MNIQNLIDKMYETVENHCLELFGCVCALAELQLTLKDEIKTDYPLKIVLDRRPFI